MAILNCMKIALWWSFLGCCALGYNYTANLFIHIVALTLKALCNADKILSSSIRRSPVGEGSGGWWINQELSNGPQKAANVWNDTWNYPKSGILLMHNPVRVCCQMSCSVITLSKIEEV